ncbi:lambda-crystallin-like [Rhagoletis pomonella]|uniref:lambda-crystallin-like n=1 Tax=Rhagoletis pomonella TaxID=28610 RepID=UPI0017870D2E|nr:lambda-crystallin-like [Rhagoletis pomonella]
MSFAETKACILKTCGINLKLKNWLKYKIFLTVKMKNEKIGIIGSGLIGRAWSMLFASVGYQVMLYDILPEQTSTALEEIEKELHALHLKSALRGKLSPAEQLECISATTDIRELVSNAIYLQECIPERIEMKRSLYAQLAGIVEPQTIMASSTSTYMPSLFSEHMPQHRENVVVAHPLNPPYYIPLVEIVPAPWTKPQVVTRVRDLMLEIGQKPVTLTRQIEGFATNRIQYAILNEVWRLVADGVVSVADVDRVMTEGLGIRYALLGPLETAHLNADGVADYFGRFGDEVYAVSQTYGPTPQMEAGETLSKIAAECEEMVPRKQLKVRREQRDKFLRELCALKKQLE